MKIGRKPKRTALLLPFIWRMFAIKHVSLVYSVVHRQSKKLGTSSSLSIAGRRNGWDHCTSGLDSTLTKLKTSLTDWLMWKMSKVTITSNFFTMSAR